MLTKTRNLTTTEYTLMHKKYIITYECHDNAQRMWKVVQLIREIFWLLPILSPLLPVVSHFSFVSTWKRSHFSLWFQSSGSPAPVADHNILFNVVMKPGSVLVPRINKFTFSVFFILFLLFSRLVLGYFSL
jgi:hypothetical protein